MRKKQMLKIIEEECLKLEDKWSIPMDIQWDDIYDDMNEEMNIEVELAFNCMRRIANGR